MSAAPEAVLAAQDRVDMRGRVLMLTSNFPRWAGDSTTPFVLHLAQDLQELGWGVDVLAPHAPGAALRETIGGVQVERFRYLWPERAQTVCYQGGALVNLRRNPWNHAKLPPLLAAELFAAVRRLRARRYDILHSHWILPQGFVGALAAKASGTPHVATVHGSDAFALSGAVLAKFKRFVLRAADAVTVNSSATESKIRRIAPGLEDLVLIPMGVARAEPDKPMAQELRLRYRRGAGPLILFVGRLVEQKGLEDLLRAVDALRRDALDVTAIIAGEGQDRESFEDLSGRLGLADRVHFVGWVPAANLPAYYAAADVFVGPSRTAANGAVEAQGLTFLEAMMAGTPVVATKLGGIVDAVRDGETGILVDERTPGQIAAAVLRLCRDAELRCRLVSSGHRLVAERFTRRASSERFSDLYEWLVDELSGNQRVRGGK